MNIIALCRKLLTQINIPRTIVFNLRMFPICTALKLPVVLGYRVDIRNIKRENIVLMKVKTGGKNWL